MKENFHPKPENPKQYAPEAGAGPLGLPPPDPEQLPQGEGSKSSKLNLPEQTKEAPEDADRVRIETIQQAGKGAAFFSGVGLGDIPLKHKGKGKVVDD